MNHIGNVVSMDPSWGYQGENVVMKTSYMEYMKYGSITYGGNTTYWSTRNTLIRGVINHAKSGL